jgi:heme-degrading monooxygenase HmoA
VFHRVEGDTAEFVLTSFWDSLESIQAFAGPDVDKARYYPQDDPYLLEKAERLVHYEVVHGLELNEDALAVPEKPNARGR